MGVSTFATSSSFSLSASGFKVAAPGASAADWDVGATALEDGEATACPDASSWVPSTVWDEADVVGAEGEGLVEAAASGSLPSAIAARTRQSSSSSDAGLADEYVMTGGGFTQQCSSERHRPQTSAAVRASPTEQCSSDRHRPQSSAAVRGIAHRPVQR